MRRAATKGSIVVLVMILVAAAFGIAFGYLQYINNSFPSKVSEFDRYASVSSYSFNGSIFSVTLRWFDSAKYRPLYAQLVSDQYASRVYDITDQLYQNNTLLLPFPVEISLPSMTNVEILIAFYKITNGADFTIVHWIGNVNRSSS